MDVTDIALCDACYIVEKSARAWAFCIECSQKLCTECQLDHSKFPAMREHKIVKLKEMTVNMIESTPIKSVLSRCDYHEMKQVKYYCYDHKEVYCSLCRAVKHANCNEKLIANVCGLLGTNDLDHILATLDLLARGLGKARQERQRQVDEMVNMKKMCVEEIWNLKQRLARLFDQLEKNADQKVAEVDKRVEEFTETTTLYEDAMQHVSSLSDQIRKMFNCSDQETIFVAQTKAQKMKIDYTSLAEHYKTDMASLRLVFNQDAHIVDVLSTCESLGEVYLQETEINTPVHEKSAHVVPADMLQLFLSKKPEYIPQVTARIAQARSSEMLDTPSPPPPPPPGPPVSVETRASSSPLFSQIVESNRPKTDLKISTSSTSAAQTGVNRKNFLNIKLKSKQNYPIGLKEDKGDCDITGLAFLPSGGLVICDHFNKTVKALDPDFHVVKCKRFGDHPWDVAVIDDLEIAVTISKMKKIQYLTIGGLAFSGSFQTKKMCWGIENFHDSIIITFHDNPGNGSVEIRSRKGEILKQISNDNEESPLFVSPFYVALDSTKERFFVTDGKNNSVVTCTATVDGKAKSIAKTEHLRWPKGIVLDDGSSMIVSAHFADQLKFLKDKGQCGCVKFCDVRRPQGLAFSWEILTLVVGTNVGQEITVLTFENK